MRKIVSNQLKHAVSPWAISFSLILYPHNLLTVVGTSFEYPKSILTFIKGSGNSTFWGGLQEFARVHHVRPLNVGASRSAAAAMPSSTSSSASSHSSQRSLQPAASAASAASGPSAASTQSSRRPDPHSVINLRLILVSGKTRDFQFHPSESAGDIAQYVFDSWPSGEWHNFVSFMLDMRACNPLCRQSS